MGGAEVRSYHQVLVIYRIYKVVCLCETRIFSKVSREQMAEISARHHHKMRNVMQHKSFEHMKTNLVILPCKVEIACEAEQKDHYPDIYRIYTGYILFFVFVESPISQERRVK